MSLFECYLFTFIVFCVIKIYEADNYKFKIPEYKERIIMSKFPYEDIVNLYRPDFGREKICRRCGTR